MGFNLPKVSGEVFFETFPVGPLQCNCSIIADPITKACVIVDPGGDPERIMSIVNENDLLVKQIVHTHAHLDHILASAEIKKRTGAPLLLHKGDQFLWDALESQCQRFGIECGETSRIDSWLSDEDSLHCCDGVAIHTPGHTLSFSFWFENHSYLSLATRFSIGCRQDRLPGGALSK